MRLYQLLLVVGIILVACSTAIDPEIDKVPEFTVEPVIESTVNKVPNPKVEEESIVDDSIWKSDGRTIRIKGCEDWKAKNSEADC